MTNEEKAREIAIKRSESYGFGFNYDSSIECYESAMEMAEWVINKACEWLKNYRQDTPDGLGYTSGVVNDRTIDDFRKAMEGEQ